MPKKINRHISFLVCCLFIQLISTSQNETAKWYFGYGSALDFMTSPPTLLTNSAMHVDEGCASISDNNGNVLFYTDGMTIYNKQHLVMANGNGLLGGHTPTQSSLILKQPGSNFLYYVFTVHGNTWAPGLHYTLVDMSLAAGNGSVVAKNVNIYPGGIYEKITAARHCNGTDYWVVVRDFSAIDTNFSENFRAFQFSSSGISATPVTSFFTYTSNFHVVGGMRISPNGKKLACANYNYSISDMTFELYDFDSSTGVVSNSVALQTSFMNNVNSFFASGYGVEFSPDGTKLYGSLANFYSTQNNGNILEWDLCAGTNSAIALSQTTIGAATGTNYFGVGSLQLAKDGKIYVAHSTTSGSIEALSVINNPNGFGAASNFSYGVVAVPSYSPSWGLPNYGSYNFLQRPSVPPFAVITNTSVGCFGKVFNAPVIQNSVALCPAASFSVNSYAWDFGDPLSGNTNTSFLTNPSHNFSAPGNYTTQLIIYYSCGGGTDTLRQTVNVSGSTSLNVTTASITCASLGSGTVTLSNGSGSYSYSWTPTNQTTSIASGLIPGNYTITVSDNSVNCSITNTLYFAPLIPLTADVVASTSIQCYGANTGTASFINLAGGSPNQYALWQNGSTSFTTLSTSSLSAGTWSATLTDALTACQVNSVFTITQPSQISVTISPSSYTACVGNSIQLIANASGGSGALNYLWSNSINSFSTAISHNSGGFYSYSVTTSDVFNCTSTQSVMLQYESIPIISVNSGSICAGDSFTISPSGAFNYNFTGGNSIVSPSVSSTYTINGTGLLGCIANSAIATVTVVQLPQLMASSSRNILCLGETAQLIAIGADTYIWSGGITSPTINISPIQTTFYTVVGANLQGCTATVAVMQQVDVCSDIKSSSEPLNSSLSIYPNPSSGTFEIRSNQPKTLLLINAIGQIVLELQLNEENQFSKTVSSLSKGLYFIQVKEMSGNEGLKIVVE
jgi:hypothetical protein